MHVTTSTFLVAPASDRHRAGYILFVEERTDRPTPDISFEFGNDLRAPRAAREALEPLFPGDGELAESVGLVASELVSNVVLHTDDGGRMDAWDADPLRLEVRDHNPQLPVPSRDHHEVGGRGLRIVAGVADRWGAVPVPFGKLVWAEFRR